MLRPEEMAKFNGGLPTNPDMIVGGWINLAIEMSRYESSNSLLLQLASCEIALQQLSQKDVFDFVPDFSKDVVMARLLSIEAQRDTILDLTEKAGAIFPTMTDSEIKQFMRRKSVEGEIKALQWLVNQRAGASH